MGNYNLSKLHLYKCVLICCLKNFFKLLKRKKNDINGTPSYLSPIIINFQNVPLIFKCPIRIPGYAPVNNNMLKPNLVYTAKFALLFCQGFDSLSTAKS